MFVPSGSDALTDHEGHGEGLIAWHLLCGLAARGHELVVCARTARLDTAPPFELIETGPAASWESVEPLAYARLARRLCERQGGAGSFDLAHWLLPGGAARTLFVPPHGLPLVVGPHSASWPTGPRTRPWGPGDLIAPLVAPLVARTRRRTLAAATVLLGTTPEALAGWPDAKAHIVPRGIDPARFSVAPLPAVPTVLFIGALRRSKGVHELIAGFATARARVPAARLVIAGEGPERSSLEQLVGLLGLGDAVTLVGPVRHEQIPALLAASSLLCLPSHGEPFGMAVLEAMAAGRAVVACDAGGPRQLVDRDAGGRLVPAGDADALGSALATLLADPAALARLGAFNRARVEAGYTLEHVVDLVEAAYAAAAAQRTAGGRR